MERLDLNELKLSVGRGSKMGKLVEEVEKLRELEAEVRRIEEEIRLVQELQHDVDVALEHFDALQTALSGIPCMQEHKAIDSPVDTDYDGKGLA